MSEIIKEYKKLIQELKAEIDSLKKENEDLKRKLILTNKNNGFEKYD